MPSFTSHAAHKAGSSSYRHAPRTTQRRSKGSIAPSLSFELSEEASEVVKNTELAIQDLLAVTMPFPLTPGFTTTTQTHDWKSRFDLMLAKLGFMADLLDPLERDHLENLWLDPDGDRSLELKDDLEAHLKAVTRRGKGSSRRMTLDNYVQSCDESIDIIERALSRESGHSWLNKIAEITGLGTIPKRFKSWTNGSDDSDAHEIRLDRLDSLILAVEGERQECIAAWDDANLEYDHLASGPEFRDETDAGDWGRDASGVYQDADHIPLERVPPTLSSSWRNRPYSPDPRYGDHGYAYGRYVDSGTGWNETINDLARDISVYLERAGEVGTGLTILAGSAYVAAKAIRWMCTRSSRLEDAS